IVVGAISQSRIGVSGPAAGLIAIILSTTEGFRSGAIPDGMDPTIYALQMLFLAVVLAGVIQLVLGLLKGGFVAYYFPNVVIKGMLAAIGLILIKKEITHGFGFDADTLGDYDNVNEQYTFFEELKIMFTTEGAISPVILALTIVSLLILIVWEREFIKKSILGTLPGAIVVVVLGILFAYITQGTSMEIVSSHRVDVAVEGRSFQDLIMLPYFAGITNSGVWIAAFTIAIVASIETLLCVEATDKIDPEKHATPPNRELVAQGVGNVLAGLLGGLPVTQVIVRSSANIEAGGKTKMAAVYHGVLLVICVFSIPFILNLIPFASLSAILFVVGYKLAKPSLFRKMFKRGWSEFIPFMVTIVGILMTDLLKGIALGMVVSVLFILYDNFNLSHYLEKRTEGGEEKYIVLLSEHMTFLNKASLNATLDSIPRDAKVVIDKRRVVHLAEDIKDVIREFQQRAKVENIEISYVNKGKNSKNLSPSTALKSKENS
ncbi:SulP family inorganic anion transporter, partial [Lishizhenia sp.]|uniref:SulP family inorganic anion transporter n=1 Tax=Lishizhenia sp. TaxID=2497594 RepID=UPI00299E5740